KPRDLAAPLQALRSRPSTRPSHTLDRRLPPMTAKLPFTGNDDADALLSEDPLALLIGFALDQQVTVQKAFSGPWELQRRLRPPDARPIAGTAPAELDRVFRERPALHRFPGSMA